MSSGRYMAYTPSPSTTPHSPRISGLRASSAAVADQEKYLAELLAERHKLNPFVPVLPHSIRLLNQARALFRPPRLHPGAVATAASSSSHPTSSRLVAHPPCLASSPLRRLGRGEPLGSSSSLAAGPIATPRERVRKTNQGASYVESSLVCSGSDRTLHVRRPSSVVRSVAAMGTLAQVMEGQLVAVNGGDPPLAARKTS